MNKPAPAQHPIQDLLAQRWSPRIFADRSVEPEKLLRLFEAARWSASSYNDQPWAFIIATRDEPAEFERMLSCFNDFNRGWTKSAPAAGLALARKNLAHNGQPNSFSWYDLGQAMANFSVQATAEGLLVHQMGGILPEKGREVYNVPADWDVASGFVFGYHGDPEALPEPMKKLELAPRQRKPLTDFVFTGAWGKARPGVS
jgi:nitroreductase